MQLSALWLSEIEHSCYDAFLRTIVFGVSSESLAEVAVEFFSRSTPRFAIRVIGFNVNLQTFKTRHWSIFTQE